MNRMRSASILAVAFLALCRPSLCGQATAADKPEQGPENALSPFGIGSCHINNRSAEDNARWVPQMAAIGIRFHRTCATSWPAVEPEEGKWTWNALDKQMKYLEDQHIAFGAILHGTGNWNKLDRPGTLPVNNLPAWSKYVTEVAKHVKGKVKYFEVWNEPPNGTGRDQTPADYAKIVVSAHDAVKAVDPSGLVGLAAKSAHVNYLEQTIKAGAKDHFDFIILHPYEVLNGVADNAGSEAVYMNIVPTVRKMLAAQNPAKVNVPIIFTELGSDAKKGADNQGHVLVKAYAMGIAQGVACIQWFEAMDGDSGPMGLLERNGAKRPSYTAMAQMIQHLGHRPAYLGPLLLNDKSYGFVFQGANGAVLAAWAPKGKPEPIDFGQEVQIVDPLTGKAVTASTHELTVAPILVLGVPEKLLTRAKANKGKPFPWGGDFSAAKSVSILFGEKTIEKGLHTASGAAVAEAVVAYGGSARAGNVPGGNLFIVDPNFLSYTATPIEITVVVRRNPANDNAGFKLIYESTSGFKNVGGWYTVPDNKKWHTVSWKINDAQFVNYWGYNFNLESDGNKFNKYYIQSVTVTKLDK
jgi:polysaccharide biosynthesis protein PslG